MQPNFATLCTEIQSTMSEPPQPQSTAMLPNLNIDLNEVLRTELAAVHIEFQIVLKHTISQNAGIMLLCQLIQSCHHYVDTLKQPPKRN